MDMGRKYFFRAPYNRSAYISLRIDSEKFTVTRDKRYIVATATHKTRLNLIRKPANCLRRRRVACQASAALTGLRFNI